MTSHDFPTLSQFFGCYFHQDWVDEFSSTEDAITAFRTGAPPEAIESVCEELDRTLLLLEQGEDSQKVLQELGCYYNPAAAGLTTIDWLEQVQEKLRRK
jgi:hypothetical protein